VSKQLLAVIVGAVVLFAVAVIGAMAFTSDDASSGGTVHTMPDGSVMTTPMDDDSMADEDEDSTMGDGSMMDEDDDSMMDGSMMGDDEDSMMDDGMGATP